MDYRRQGFTLIELLVVIAIIGILATLVITQLAAAQIRARNSSAQNDIGQARTAIEAFKNIPDNYNGDIIAAGANTAGGGVTLNGTTSSAWTFIFTGKELFGASGNQYSANISKTPNSSYTYSYVTKSSVGSGTAPVSGGGTVHGVAEASYAVSTNIDVPNSTTDTYFAVINGTTDTTGSTWSVAP